MRVIIKQILVMSIVFSIVLFCFQSNLVIADPLQEIKFMTEDFKPFNMQLEGEDPSGIAVDLLLLMMKKANAPIKAADIKKLPWKRGYMLIQRDEGTALFSMARTEERENLFKWVGPFAHTKTGAVGLKKNKIKITQMEDLKKYKMGVIGGDIGEMLARKKIGIPDENIQIVFDVKSNLLKLQKGRIHFFMYEFNAADVQIRAHGMDTGDFEKSYAVIDAQLYFAFHRNTDDSIITRLQNALDEIKAEGILNNITLKYYGGMN